MSKRYIVQVLTHHKYSPTHYKVFNPITFRKCLQYHTCPPTLRYENISVIREIIIHNINFCSNGIMYLHTSIIIVIIFIKADCHNSFYSPTYLGTHHTRLLVTLIVASIVIDRAREAIRVCICRTRILRARERRQIFILNIVMCLLLATCLCQIKHKHNSKSLHHFHIV